MSNCAPRRELYRSGLAFLLLAAGACGGAKSSAAAGREIPWTYGPTTGGASKVHAQGTGEGGAKIAVGWKFRLLDGKRLTVQPYQLAADHPLFGKVGMNVGLFDKADKEQITVSSKAITAENASFAWDLDEAVAKELASVVIWYVKI